ncbi:MAG: DUF839 domain-containing protein [Phycisphaerae bacterium]|nr:DUF839 domain-containing protein [Phycisphaerae bacterium]
MSGNEYAAATSEARASAFSRRHFLRTAAATALGFTGLRRLLEARCWQVPEAADIPLGYGPLVSDPGKIIDLPSGFSYRVISRAGDRMSDGLLVPGYADGMAAFPAGDGQVVLVRNHEIGPDWFKFGAFGRRNELLGRLDSSAFYDFGHGATPGLGGTSTILFDPRDGKVLREYLSLAGTVNNCAGGPTPWNTWITCEETTMAPDNSTWVEKPHGYAFEVPATGDGAIARPTPLRAMGRFRREAVAVDPRTGIVYQTEDINDGCIYRFLPKRRGVLAEGGRLQALGVIDKPKLDTKNWEEEGAIAVGATCRTMWIDLDDVEAPKDDLRLRAYEAGAARFSRAEGMWYGRDCVYFACTTGGRNQRGQIWRYTPSPAEGAAAEAEAPGVLELFIEPNDAGLIDNADNLTLAPWGDLIVCEDGSGEQFLVGITPQGEIYKFARNAKDESEFAGACFSPDGGTFFVNLQEAGLTLAITGPWRRA